MHTVTRAEYFEKAISAENRPYYQMALHCMDWHIFRFFIIDFEIESKTSRSAVVIARTLFSYPIAKVILLDIEGENFDECTVVSGNT